MEKAQGRRDRMERAAFSSIQPVCAPEYFGKEPLRFGAASEQMAMVSVRSEKIIVRAQTRDRRHAGALLSDVKVIVAVEHAFVVKRHQVFFKVTDDKHPPTQVKHRFAW